MAHKKAAGSTSLGRDSQGQRLGVKIGDGDKALAGQIIVRQRGSKIHPGEGVRKGGDDTLYAAKEGFVKFTKKKVRNYTGALQLRTFAHILDKKTA
jgi:large subunit ribosomal protein L27